MDEVCKAYRQGIEESVGFSHKSWTTATVVAAGCLAESEILKHNPIRECQNQKPLLLWVEVSG